MSLTARSDRFPDWIGMRWSIVRIIWLRELRDQLRDRRTLFMVAGLPLSGSPAPARLAGAAALAHYSHVSNDYPLLVRGGKFVPLYLQQPEGIRLVPLSESKLQIHWLDKHDRDLLDTKKIDVLLSAD